MYQPKIKEHLIRKLYVLAKRERKKMTHMINEILEEYLVTEPDPPEEGRKDGRIQRPRRIPEGIGNGRR